MISESEVRKLRDNIYGPCTDKNWEECKVHWMHEDAIEWLRVKQPVKGEIAL